LEPGTCRYNIPQAVQLSGDLQVEKLQQSLDTIVARHASLRTTFTIEDGSPMQVIAPAQPVNLPIVDLSNLSEDGQEREARRLAVEEGRQPFDLTRGPLMRTQLLRLAQDKYILLLTLHHIISDGWSVAVFFRELGVLYNALIEDKPSPLGELPIQYADFTLWQRSYLQGQELQNQLAYWKLQLVDAPVVLELPTDYPRPLTPGEPGSKAAPAVLHDLKAELTQRIKALSQREGVTLFMTLMAAFKALLHHYTGQDDIVVGSPIAGRNHTETEDCIGAFVNTLVLRTKLEGNPTFRELLRREREVALGAYAHQEMPFEKLLEELQPQRSLHHTPLFQVFFNMLNLPPVHAELSGLVTEHLALLESSCKVRSHTLCRGTKGKYLSEIVYDSELFHAETIQRMAAHFQTLLEGVVANADLRLSQLPLLTESERLQRSTPVNRISPRNEFIRWSQQETYSTLYRRFEQQVERNPRQIAVKTTSHQWSYDELNQRANHIAHSILSRCGDGKGDEPQRVALLFEHGAPMIAAILGVLKAGKTYVPLEPAHPQERLALIVVDVQATAIVTNNSHLALAAALAADILHLINADDVEDAVVASDAVTVDSSPHDAAYILYTSGSTGKPKGVVQSHRNVLGHIRNYSNNLHIRSDDRLTLFSSYGFDAAVMDIFAALLNGATFYPIDVKEHGVASLSRYLSEQEITIFHSTPTLYRYFMSTLPVGETLRHLRLVVLGGEEVVRTDVELYKKHCSSDCLFVNGFGPTEATVVLQNFIDHQTPLTRHAVPIGYPVEDSEILLLNKDGEEVELFGEITVRSPHVALGYWQEPKLTRAVFPPDPAQGDKRIYRTGDLGRRLANGAIEFVGRKDFQVKIRGHRIELREIESVVSRHPSVREAVVMAQRNGLGEAGLVAYVVGVDEAVLSGSQLRQFTQTKLPDYMVPGTFVLLDKMPLIENGKIDRQALLRLPQEEGDCPQTPARPQNELEGQLIESWKKVLNRQQIGVRDNFFDLGGHSLLAVSLVASIEQEFGCKLSLGTLFQMPTVERLASFITQQVHQEHQTTPSRSLVAIQPRGSKQPLFMVHDASGTLWCYHALAQYMGTDQPVYGFQVPVVHDNSHLPRTVDSIAARYVDELCEFQPQGPYFLGGFSLGGALAFEMAQQLREQGREVALLALLDTGCPGAHRETATPLQTAQLYLRNLRSMNRHDALMHVSSRVLRKAPKGTPVSLDELADESIREALFESATQHQLPQAFNSYEVRSYAGGVVLFRASLHFRGFDDSLGWQRVAKGELRVEFVPGSHATMVMEPHVRHLAARLKLHINSAQSSQVV
jgi:amino acid adenylation domain-containing protein